MSVLTVDNISFSYRSKVPTLHDVSFQVQNKEFLSLVGPNGSGKTTLLRLLDRIYVPHKGSIHLADKNINVYSRADLAKRIAFVPQDASVLFPFSVLEIVLMGRSPPLPRRFTDASVLRATAIVAPSARACAR